jgi:hypothetical protein
MPYPLYKVLHVLAVAFLFASAGGLTILTLLGRDEPELVRSTRRWLHICFGVALVLILVAGFGLLARLGVAHGTAWPVWAYVKLGIWMVLGASLALVRRAPSFARLFFFLLPLIGGVAIYAAIYKPGA